MGAKTAQRLPAPPVAVGAAHRAPNPTQKAQRRPYRDTASFGKRSEFIAMAELLRRGFDVYATLVDDQGIDCIVRLDSTRYVDVQIKARSEGAKQAHLFANMRVEARPNLFFMLHTALHDDYVVIPSAELARLCSVNKVGKHRGRFSLALPRRADSPKVRSLAPYRGEDGFALLRNWQPDGAESPFRE